MSILEKNDTAFEALRMSPDEYGAHRANCAKSFKETDGNGRHFQFDLTEQGGAAHDAFLVGLGIPAPDYLELTGEVEQVVLDWKPEQAPNAHLTRQVVPSDKFGAGLVFYFLSNTPYEDPEAAINRALQA